MGREVRMVPASWVHPVDAKGEHIPLYEPSFRKAAAEWDEESRQWDAGFVRDYSQTAVAFKPRKDGDPYSSTYEEYAGARPSESDYMPDWTDAERTHLMMYETCTEGTPLSPPIATAEELAKYLAETGASSFGYDTATYDQLLRMIRARWAPSAVFSPGVGIVSGVAGFPSAEPTTTPPDSTPVTTAQSPADATGHEARPTSLSE